MGALDILNWIKKSLLAQKLRASLTIVGFSTGIAAVVLMSTIGDSLRLFILQEFTQFGTNIVAITPGKTETFGAGGILNTIRPLSLDDAQDLAKKPSIEYAIPIVMGTAKIKANGRARHTEVAGVGAYTAKAWKLTLSRGKFLPDDDIDVPRSYAVIGAKLKQELFANQSAIGEYLNVGSQRFTIIGELKPKGQFMGTDLDDMVYIPTAKAMSLFNRESLMELDIFYRQDVNPKALIEEIRSRLIKRHGMEDFTIISQDDMLDTLENILNIIKAVGTALGGISLFVGAVSIATIMTITVTERTWEIGLLSALGFSGSQIRQLFLAEAALLALVSGFTGYLVVAIIVGLLTFFYPQVPIELSLTVLWGSLLISACIGLIAGLKPAMNAAKLTPVDALRAE